MIHGSPIRSKKENIHFYQVICKTLLFVEYMYAFSQGDSANVVIRTDDINKCAEVLKQNKIELIAANELYKL